MNDLYSFAYKGLLTQEALDAAGRKTRPLRDVQDEEILKLIPIDSFDEEIIADARSMSLVYVVIASFENSVRKLISSTLLESKGENWWLTCVSERIRTAAQNRLEEEKKVRWHVQRGEDPINFTMLPNLLNIIRNNMDAFEPFIHDIEWAAAIFDVIERSRNVIMHSGRLSRRDIARLGLHIKDWTTQVAL